MDRGTLTLRNKRRTLMIKIKNRCCYTVTLILCGTLFLTGLTGCKSREAQFLIDGLQEAKAEVDAESSEEKTSGQKSKKDTDEKKADTEDRQNDDGSSAEFRKKQAESDGSDAGNGTGSDSGKHTSDADIDKNRIASEVIIYADKVCVDEETVRLRSHIEHARKCLNEDGGIGRKMDFIAQEMNREANTTLSKANNIEISNAAIDLKTEIEKIREQIQNIE